MLLLFFLSEPQGDAAVVGQTHNPVSVVAVLLQRTTPQSASSAMEGKTLDVVTLCLQQKLSHHGGFSLLLTYVFDYECYFSLVHLIFDLI